MVFDSLLNNRPVNVAQIENLSHFATRLDRYGQGVNKKRLLKNPTGINKLKNGLVYEISMMSSFFF